jgi:mRNA interferase RelE/StbE
MAFSPEMTRLDAIRKAKLWTVEFSPFAISALQEMGRRQAAFIIGFIERQLHERPDARSIGKRLRCSQRNIWRYRVGEYRFLCQLNDEKLIILIIWIDSQLRRINDYLGKEDQDME